MAIIKEKDKERKYVKGITYTFFAPFLMGFPTIPPQAYTFTATDLFTPFVSGLAKGIADAIGAHGARRSEER